MPAMYPERTQWVSCAPRASWVSSVGAAPYLRHLGDLSFLLRSYCRLRLVGSVVLKPQPFFLSWVLCAHSWACSVRCLPFLDSALFSAPGVDEFRTMHVFGASSLAASVNTLNGGVFKRRRFLTAIPGLHLVQRSARFPCKTVQYQLHKLLRLHKHTLNFQIVLWHDTINNSITPHSSNFYNPLSPQELVEAISALLCPVSAIVYCHRNNSLPIFDQLSWSFLTVHAVKHLLSHRKPKNIALLRKYSELHLDISLEIRMFFLISKHISDLHLLTKKKSRLNNKRRRSRFRKQQLQQPTQHPQFQHHHPHQHLHTR